MAISRVPGYSLVSNLDRKGTDVSITSNGPTITYWDVANKRFGIGDFTPPATLSLAPGSDTDFGNARLSNIALPTQPLDATNKMYVDTALASGGDLVGNNIVLGTPTDGSPDQAVNPSPTFSIPLSVATAGSPLANISLAYCNVLWTPLFKDIVVYKGMIF